MKNKIKILAIETSCDETAAAILEFEKKQVKILSNVVSSQVKTHAKYGGVVPEVAARMHMEQIIFIVDQALQKAKINKDEITAIAMTGGPGLITSLLIGTETAKTLAYAWRKPLINVNHIEAHIYSALLGVQPVFPALSLIVSGGHTELIVMKDHGQYERVGGTRDDAVGEAFDKVAKMLELGYPGGPVISRMAKDFKKTNNLKSGKKIVFPRPMIESNDFEMSFSGIKTSVLYTLQKIEKLTTQIKKEICYEFQEAVTDVLVYKTVDAAQKLKVKSIILGGGVCANQRLREKLQLELKLSKINLYLPLLEYSGDNATMVAIAGYQHFLKNDFIEPFGFRADPNWELA